LFATHHRNMTQPDMMREKLLQWQEKEKRWRELQMAPRDPKLRLSQNFLSSKTKSVYVASIPSPRLLTTKSQSPGSKSQSSIDEDKENGSVEPFVSKKRRFTKKTTYRACPLKDLSSNAEIQVHVDHKVRQPRCCSSQLIKGIQEPHLLTNDYLEEVMEEKISKYHVRLEVITLFQSFI
jgi:hypothetical protein